MASFDQINAFINVYELQGYSAAARKLSKGRTTIRELILTLEESLQLTLFNIEGRQAKPTSNADRLYPHAKFLQTQFVKFSGLTESLISSTESKINLYYDAMLPSVFMVELSALLHQNFPNTEIVWQMDDWTESLNLVASNVNSVAFLANKNRSFTKLGIEVCFLGFNDFAVFSGAKSKLADLKVIREVDLRNTVQLIPRSMKEEGINGYISYANNTISVTNNDEVCRLLTQVGWAILPKKEALAYVEKGEIVHLQPHFMLNDLKMSMAAYYRPSINRGPAMTYLMSLLAPLSQKYFT